jgi:hypothetical protein
MTERKQNHLIKENSPYLLQHACNPVDWHPWGNNALNVAREQNMLMIISIGYASCHWCHVMERESFEDEEVATVMNRDYVSIKVDREERPDIDQVYMAAAYATSGRGGWPLNVIALPDQRPIFAGTYYSKRDWLQILSYLSELYRSNPEELFQHATEIAKGMKKHQLLPFPAETDQAGLPNLDDIFKTLEDDLDFENGGTHGAPKFPMPANIAFLLDYGTRYGNSKALNHVDLTLDLMAMGGIYDHLGGGFSRYSVDSRWHVPHFEKMLYDNAQLISLYAQAYKISRKYGYKKVVEETISFIERELTSSTGLFYASIDADSEGVEGAFYTWSMEDIGKYLGDNTGLFLAFYSCEEKGNWENNLNVLRKSLRDDEFAAIHNISTDQLSALIDVYNNQLFTVRSNRIRPATDDKILTCWNALMISALVDASKAFNKPLWLDKAIVAANFYNNHLMKRNCKLWRNSKAGSFSNPGFLDDYCFLIKSFTDLYQATFDNTWLSSAELLTKEVMVHFTASDGLFFCLSSDEGPRLIQETIELSDNVIPSSNAQMAKNLHVLGYLLNNDEYLLRSEAMMNRMILQIRRNPLFHANWASLLADYCHGPSEINIVGENQRMLLNELSGFYLPGAIFSGSQNKTSRNVEENHGISEKTLIYICQGKTCYPPVETVKKAMQLLQQY